MYFYSTYTNFIKILRRELVEAKYGKIKLARIYFLECEETNIFWREDFSLWSSPTGCILLQCVPGLNRVTLLWIIFLASGAAKDTEGLSFSQFYNIFSYNSSSPFGNRQYHSTGETNFDQEIAFQKQALSNISPSLSAGLK